MAYAPSLSWDVSKRFNKLNTADCDVFLAEYVWIGNNGDVDLRSKTRTLTTKPESLSDFPVWNFDGSSTNQAPGSDSEIYLKPVAFYRDPFRAHSLNFLVLCECCLPDAQLTAIPSNSRRHCANLMAEVEAAKPWFGIEQEYLLKRVTGEPLGWPPHGYPPPQGPYYCGIGADHAFGRQIVDAHYQACIYAKLNISGVNAEVAPGQWEYQVGPCVGIESGDQMWMSRYILIRVAEEFGVLVSFDPKPIEGDWNGAGAHTNYSTEEMRNDNGWEAILLAVDKLSARHIEHIEVYGEGNHRRLTGKHETAPIDKFSAGVASRQASIRIPRQAQIDKKGYFEDRRPASNMDPYKVTARIVETTLLETDF